VGPEIYNPSTWAEISPTISRYLDSFTNERELRDLEWKPILFLIPSRIGIDRINESYVPHLKHLLSSRYSLLLPSPFFFPLLPFSFPSSSFSFPLLPSPSLPLSPPS
jgi:hypothetical protein